ncbi:hypothetical protein HYZ05_00655 [Candidatus Daviesbacteria bacterium]|nr:hypothetical protein [Candidatus Daviesbacteria bacterium]
MVKLLSTIILILSISLFPPAALAVISNNAVPGDATYPIKRILESGIYAVASLHPITRVWFSTARSDRRFKEFKTLIAQGKSAEKTINELVNQTEIAAKQIDQISSPQEKEKFVRELVVSIQKYDQGLAQLPQIETTPAPVISTPQPTIEPTVTPTSTPMQSEPIPKITPTSRPTPQSTPVITTSKPTATPIPSLTPAFVPTTPPVVAPPSGSFGNDQAVEDARKKLKEIEDELKRRSSIKSNHKNEKREDSLTPQKDDDKIKKEKR